MVTDHSIVKNPKAQKMAYGEEMYAALKAAAIEISKTGMNINSFEFSDSENAIYFLPTAEHVCIDLGYRACRIMNGLPKG